MKEWWQLSTMSLKNHWIWGEAKYSSIRSLKQFSLSRVCHSYFKKIWFRYLSYLHETKAIKSAIFLHISWGDAVKRTLGDDLVILCHHIPCLYFHPPIHRYRGYNHAIIQQLFEVQPKSNQESWIFVFWGHIVQTQQGRKPQTVEAKLPGTTPIDKEMQQLKSCT